MTPADFRTALKQLGLTQVEFAAFCGMSVDAVNAWTVGRRGIPGWLPVMLRLMERDKLLT